MKLSAPYQRLTALLLLLLFAAAPAAEALHLVLEHHAEDHEHAAWGTACGDEAHHSCEYSHQLRTPSQQLPEGPESPVAPVFTEEQPLPLPARRPAVSNSRIEPDHRGPPALA